MKKIKTHFILSLLLVAINITAQRNTVFIIADDVSPDYFGFYSSTDTANTPNIRTLLAKGIKFSKVWAAPVCSPSRAGIFTGRYSFRTGVGAVVTGTASAQLDTVEMSIAKLLQRYAPIKYNTANLGKWHLHTQTLNQRTYPNYMGYNFYSGNFNGQLNNYYNYTRITNGVFDTVHIYATTQTVDDAIGWIDTMSSGKPFFLWLAFNAPHSPFHLPPSTLCNTSGLSGTAADISTNPKNYFKAAIEAMDTEIGRLFQYLNTNNLMDSTNIIFIGDNGNESQVAKITNPNKSKATLYDYGVHVPMIIAGPSVVNPNRTSNALVNTHDLFATIAEWSGFPNWKNFIPSGTVVDSKSLMPIITNQSNTTRTWIFTEQFAVPTATADGKTIRNADYHLIRLDNGIEEFYNQTLDPFENTNLINNMSSQDIANYNELCDTLHALIGTQNCLSTGINILNIGNTNFVYPNPFSSFIFIDDALLLDELELIDGKGKAIYKGFHINQINFSYLPSGVYFLKDITQHHKSMKLLKE